jgi:hypothetical protein
VLQCGDFSPGRSRLGGAAVEDLLAAKLGDYTVARQLDDSLVVFQLYCLLRPFLATVLSTPITGHFSDCFSPRAVPLISLSYPETNGRSQAFFNITEVFDIAEVSVILGHSPYSLPVDEHVCFAPTDHPRRLPLEKGTEVSGVVDSRGGPGGLAAELMGLCGYVLRTCRRNMYCQTIMRVVGTG